MRTAGFGRRPPPGRTATRLGGVHDALAAYFAGDVDALDAIAVAPEGTLVPAAACGSALREIRAGETISYGELAERVGAPGAARAVGMANATNPIALIVPCHRVIRTGGALGGYGFGVDRKRWLLAHEARPGGLFAARVSRESGGPRPSSGLRARVLRSGRRFG